LPTLENAALRVQQGEFSAFEAIVKATSAQLVRVAARVIGDMAEAEDVVQESYISAYQALIQGQFDGRSHLNTWLRRIVINRSIDALRGRRRRPRLDDSQTDVAWDGVMSAESRLALTELADWMSSLAPEQRAALVLSVFEGLSNAEIADAMGCSEGAIEQRLVRARAALRQRNQKNG
jgi:RNA polymerase sigma-70 factor (ECF subfamily)